MAFPTTWNPSDKNANCVLSGADLVASRTSTASVGEVRTVDYGGASALLYCEVVLTVAGIFSGNAVGFANSTFAVGVGDSSNDANAITAWTDGNVYHNSGTAVGAWMSGSPSNGDVLSVAVDTTNKRFWARRNSGNWNNSGAADPATNTGGYAITNAGPYTVIGTLMDANSGTVTLRVAALSVPSGFTDMMAAAAAVNKRLLTLGAG